MKLIRKKIRLIALVMAILVMFVSCEQYDNIENHIDYTGEEIFKGIFFLQNEIADNISFLKDTKKEIENASKSADIIQKLDEISVYTISYINIKYPRFFNDFEKTIKSGNLYQIENEINKSSNIIEQSMLASSEYSKYYALSKSLEQNPNLLDKIRSLDLTDKEGIKELELIKQKSNITLLEEETDESLIVAAALALFYVAVIAVSIAAVLYSVVVKAAHWGRGELRGPDKSIQREVIISDIGDLFIKR